MPVKRKRTKLQREEDMVAIADLYKRGWTMRKILARINDSRPYSLSLGSIKNDIDRVLKRWREKQSSYIDNFITVQIEQIQEMKRELWNEYLRSKKSLKSVKEKRKAIVRYSSQLLVPEEDLSELELDLIMGGNTEKPKDLTEEFTNIEIHFTDLSKEESGMVEVDQTIQATEKLGNPRYLELLAKLMEQEARLLGFYNTDNITPTTSVVIVNMPAPMSQQEFTPIDLPNTE